VSPSYVAVRMRQAGLTEVIPQWLLGLFGAKSVFIGAMGVVNGRLTLKSAIAADSTFINFTDHLLVLYVTVVTVQAHHQVGTHIPTR